MYIKASGGGSGGTTYTSYTKSSIAVYNQSGHKWTYTFDPNKLYIMEGAGASAAGRQWWLVSNGQRYVMQSSSHNNVNISWNASTLTVTITVSISYSVTLYVVE